MRRVVVTGMGAVTPIGIGVDTFWENVKKKTLGFGEITRFDTTDYKVHIAAEVKDFAGKDYMDFKAAKRMELFCQYAVAAAKEAFEQAGLDMEKEDPFRVGCSIGSGIGSLQAAETACHKIAEKGPSRVNPLLVPLMISNMAAGNVSIQLGLKGKSLNVVTACATGTHSIGEAYRSIQCGDADVMLATFAVRDDLLDSDGEHYLCGLSLRIARDLFATLPVTHVIVTATQKEQPIKRVDFPRSAMQNARFQFVDPVTFVGQLKEA